MEIKTVEFKGYIKLDNSDDVHLTQNKEDTHYDIDSIGEQIADHFRSIGQTVDISLDDWTTDGALTYRDVFCRYYISSDPISWEQITEDQIKTMAGALDIQKRYDGYSEYTIIDSWVDLLIGNHNLRTDLVRYVGKYALIRIDYKI